MRASHCCARANRVIDSLPRILFPKRRRGLRWLKEEIHRLRVSAPLAPGCLKDFLESAIEAAPLSRGAGESYAASLRREIEARAHFIKTWTTTDERLSEPALAQCVDIARRHLLPRSWTISETSVSAAHRDRSFAVPERLIVRGPRGQLTSGQELPGTQILSDLRRAGDKL